MISRVFFSEVFGDEPYKGMENSGVLSMLEVGLGWDRASWNTKWHQKRHENGSETLASSMQMYHFWSKWNHH